MSLQVICRLIGAGLMFGSGLAVLRLMSERERARLYRLDCLIAIVELIRSDISRYLTPIGDIFRRCDPEILAGCLTGCRDAPCPRDMRELYRAMEKGDYAADGGSILGEFARTLGSSYRDEEIRECDVCITELTALRERLACELPVRRRSAGALGFCAMASVVILTL